MSNRKIRVGELIKREVSDIVHTRLRGSAVYITITSVDVSPDNRNATVFFSVVETRDSGPARAQSFLERNRPLIKRELAKRIVLKYMPELTFSYDRANEAAVRVNELLDSLEIPDEVSEDEEPGPGA